MSENVSEVTDASFGQGRLLAHPINHINSCTEYGFFYWPLEVAIIGSRKVSQQDSRPHVYGVEWVSVGSDLL